MILPPKIRQPDPYIAQVVLMFTPLPGGPPLLLSLASMFGKVHCLRCLGCEQELWQVIGGISERQDLQDKMIRHIGSHIPAAEMVYMEKVQ